MKKTLAAGALAALTLLTATTAVAQTGPSITTDRPCYREGAAASIQGTGFAPGSNLAITYDGRQLTSPTDPQPVGPNAEFGYPSGAFSGTLSVGRVPSNSAKRTLTATDTANPAITASVSLTVTKFFAIARPRRLTPGDKLTVSARGFYGGGRKLYAHVRGPRKRNIAIGRVKGPCGKASGKKVLLRAGDPPGIYRIQYDTKRRFSSKTKVAFTDAFQIRRVFRSSSAGVTASRVAP